MRGNNQKVMHEVYFEIYCNSPKQYRNMDWLRGAAFERLWSKLSKGTAVRAEIVEVEPLFFSKRAGKKSPERFQNFEIPSNV